MKVALMFVVDVLFFFYYYVTFVNKDFGNKRTKNFYLAIYMSEFNSAN